MPEIGAYIREQRKRARLSLRKLSELAGVSNPYLSQIERGLRRPSERMLQAIAAGLRVSAESLYAQAGALDHRSGETDVVRAISRDSRLTEGQRQALTRQYERFRAETEERRLLRRERRPASAAGGES